MVLLVSMVSAPPRPLPVAAGAVVAVDEEDIDPAPDAAPPAPLGSNQVASGAKERAPLATATCEKEHQGVSTSRTNEAKPAQPAHCVSLHGAAHWPCITRKGNCHAYLSPRPCILAASSVVEHRWESFMKLYYVTNCCRNHSEKNDRARACPPVPVSHATSFGPNRPVVSGIHNPCCVDNSLWLATALLRRNRNGTRNCRCEQLRN